MRRTPRGPGWGGAGRRTRRKLLAAAVLAAPALAAASVELAGERRVRLAERPAADGRLAVRIPLRLDSPVLALAPAGAALRDPADQPLAADAVRFEIVDHDGGPLPAGAELAARVLVRADLVVRAGEYPLTLALRFVPGGEADLAPGPPAERRVELDLVLSRRQAVLAASLAGRLEARIVPWAGRVSLATRLHVTETSGQGATPPLELVARGPARAEDHGGREAALGLAAAVTAPAADSDSTDLGFEIAGPARAGRYRVPLELGSGGAAAPVPVEVEVWLRHHPGLLASGLAGGVLLGALLSALQTRARRAEARAGSVAEARARIERLVAQTADRPLAERLTEVAARLARAEQAARGGPAEARRLGAEADGEALVALRDLEGRRLAAETALVAVEGLLQSAPGDPPEVEQALASLLRRGEALRHRLDRGEVSEAAAAVDALRVEAVREVGEAERRWLVLARDQLDALRARIPQSARVHLLDSVRYPLETLAQRVAEGSTERIRDTILAGRQAAQALAEQSFALGWRPVLRDLADLAALLAEHLPEAALRPIEAARRAAEAALEAAGRSEPLAAIERLAEYQDAFVPALELLASESANDEPWKAVREAVGLREYGRVAEAVESALRHRSRDATAQRRHARVLEIVRLAPRPSPPRCRILWDSPPAVGFPALVRLVWLGSEPRRWSVTWAAEGLEARIERPNVGATSLRFAEPGWATLRAVVEVEGEPSPLVAQVRLRVLPEAPVAAAAGRGGAWVWVLAERTLAAAAAVGLGLALLGPRFTGTPADYALAAGFGLLAALLGERLRGLVTARPAAASSR